ncbi:hypothetical protein HPP92_013462 [Vanilla planifolia]|uniref:Uncharacterized protein n=1 Tax=Vanilla planifolia TaxID=51239 RepID=A0A835R2F9_VANPL|nr:hypothetical protein HPP92_013462 [Vanilla planifolia]
MEANYRGKPGRGYEKSSVSIDIRREIYRRVNRLSLQGVYRNRFTQKEQAKQSPPINTPSPSSSSTPKCHRRQLEKKSNPLPRRGQVKARIFGSLVRSVIPSSLRYGRRQRWGDGEAGFNTATPATSGYASEESSEA